MDEQRIPIELSNTENKLLEERIEFKSKQLLDLQNQREENLDRIQLIEQHQKLIEDELASIQRLLNACRTEEITEKSYVNIYLIEKQRLEKIIVNADIDIGKYRAQKNVFLKEIDQLKSQLAKIQNSTTVDQDELDRCIELIKKRDEEAFALMKYTREDNSRIKDLTFELNRNSERFLQLKRSIQDESIDYSSYEIELDKLAEQFRRSYSQRQQLIQHWESILEQLQRKDQQIETLSLKFIEIKSQTRLKHEQLIEQKKFFENEQKANSFLEKFIDLAEKKLASLRIKQQSSNDNCQSFENDISSIKFVLINTENQVQQERALVIQLRRTIRTYVINLTKLKHRHQRIVNRKISIINAKYSLEEKCQQFECLMLNEEKYQQTLRKQLLKFEKKYFFIHNELYNLRQQEKDIERKHQAYRNQLVYSKNQIRKFDQELLKQQEIIYHHDFIRQTIDRRLNRFLNERTQEKFNESESKIRELQNEFETKKNQMKLIENQLKILHDELRIVKHDYEQFHREKQDFNEKFLQFDVYLVLTEKLIKKLNTQKEVFDYLVEEKLLHIELKRLKTHLHQSSEVNSNLEQQQIEIQKSIKERRLEIQVNIQLFRIKFNDERTKKLSISTEFAQKTNKIEKLKHRYEILAMSLNTDEKNIVHQTQHVIQFAQIKEELFRQGDQLEGLVRKGEKELRALENTVQILKWNNKDMKKNFEKLNSTDPELLLIEELEEHLRAVSEQVKIRRKKMKNVDNDEQSINSEEIQQMNEIIDGKQQLQTKLEHDIQQYHTKINRAEQHICQIKKIQSNFIESDIDICLLQETTQKLEQQLISFCLNTNDSTLRNTFEQLSTQNGWKIDRNSSKIQTKKSSTMSQNFTPNIVNVFIDKNLSKRQSPSGN